MSLPKEYLKWVQRAGSEDHVSFEAFVERFNYNDQASATEDYLQLLESDEIRRKRRDALKASFTRFQRNHERQFWQQRELETSQKMYATRAKFQASMVEAIESEIAFAQLIARRRQELDDIRRGTG
ncbi:hypothetical protein DFQ27_008386 [Actinomortierella ambigua]|uniref:Uncharacterized protein n=1 Tax=Actinomortierella ambigua TaxID=1343610 RepID=A0A9P6QFY0_9FUNG|nr:hypothetical protein DFQ27_008386 [Actinomortierella ambigua]